MNEKQEALAKRIESEAEDLRLNGLQDTELRTIAADLRAHASPGGGWRPIESAPRDGTQVLLLLADGYCVCAEWSELSDGTCIWEIGHNGDTRQAPAASATHWQPLPPPPAAKEEGMDPALFDKLAEGMREFNAKEER